jgi:hypothetical protein
MSTTTTINLQVAQQRTAPRGAAILGNAFANFLNSFRAAPAERSAARDIRRARELAAEWNRRDPRSAADLTAAIDRFEQQQGQ